MEWPLVNERKVLLKFGQELTKETWDMRLLHQNFNAVHAAQLLHQNFNVT